MSDETTKSAKAPRKKSTPAPKLEKVKANLSLGVDAYRKLFITSVMSGQSASAIVEGLIVEGLRQWALPANLADRASKRQVTTSASSDVHVETPMADLAA